MTLSLDLLTFTHDDRSNSNSARGGSATAGAAAMSGGNNVHNTPGPATTAAAKLSWQVTCRATSPGGSSMHLLVTEHAVDVSKERAMAMVKLSPPMVLHNLMAIPLWFCLYQPLVPSRSSTTSGSSGRGPISPSSSSSSSSSADLVTRQQHSLLGDRGGCLACVKVGPGMAMPVTTAASHQKPLLVLSVLAPSAHRRRASLTHVISSGENDDGMTEAGGGIGSAGAGACGGGDDDSGDASIATAHRMDTEEGAVTLKVPVPEQLIGGGGGGISSTGEEESCVDVNVVWARTDGRLRHVRSSRCDANSGAGGTGKGAKKKSLEQEPAKLDTSSDSSLRVVVGKCAS